AVALRLAADGFTVCVTDLPSNATKLRLLSAVVDEIKAATGPDRASSAHLADVSVDEEVRTMVAEVVRLHGSLDVMVANAGIMPWVQLAEMSADEWDRLMAINVRRTFPCYKYA
ncbi:hypothetical protein GGX14DRAFT_296983, partial [Mycena pura]